MSFKESIFETHAEEQAIRVVYSDWGAKDGFPIVCIHGLTGNGHDFDFIAPSLIKDGYRVIAVDLPGRGRSDFLRSPLLYSYELYLAVLIDLLDSLGLKEVDWLGVSLGGLLGMRVAAEKKLLIRRLILNDIGPEVPEAALDFIYQVIKTPYYFDSVDALEKRMRETRGLTWGPVTELQWAHMAKHNARPLENGIFTYAYDSNIARVFEKEPIGAVQMWPCWEAIDCAILVLHGEKSVLLTEETLEQMKARGPSFDLVTFKDCGHVPSLMEEGQIKCILDWLN